MRRIASLIIRISSFVSKEIVEILRQTRLMLVLVLGPFLILLLFGLGYRNEARVLRTLFVISEGDQLAAEQVQEYATSLGPQLDFRGITANQGEAMSQLTRGSIDAVVIVPDNVEQRIRNSEQPVFQLYHREIDPFQVSYVDYVAQIYVDEVNRRVLRNIAEEGQVEAADVQDDLQTARASARAMREAFERGDADEAQRQRSEMNTSLDAVTLAVGGTLGVLQGAEQALGQGGENGSMSSEVLSTFAEIEENDQSLASTPSDREEYSEEAARARDMEEDLDRLNTQLEDFRQIESHVLVSPFRAEAVSVTNVELTSSDFFSPGVIILLLQHLLATFAALSIVREKISGTMEMFRVAPISAFETLLGKYLAYMFIGAILAAIISALLVFILGVPMLGSWRNFALIMLAVMFASLGLGFLISLLSETTTQSVQYAMLVLLFSIFFSGFFLDLRLMWDRLRFISFGIPATYGLQLLQEVMFRANPIQVRLMGGLLAYGLVLFIVCWLLLRHQMRTR